MLKTTIIAGGLALSVCGPAAAQDWTSVGSGGGQTFYYDASSVEKAGGSVTFTTKVVYAGAGAETGAADGASAAWSIAKVSLNCSASTLEHLDFAWYAADGSKIDAPDPDRPGPHAFVAGSGDAAYQAALCG